MKNQVCLKVIIFEFLTWGDVGLGLALLRAEAVVTCLLQSLVIIAPCCPWRQANGFRKDNLYTVWDSSSQYNMHPASSQRLVFETESHYVGLAGLELSM